MEIDLLLKMIFGVVGGLGIFLLGMRTMSEGMQTVAGDRIRMLINAVTTNRVVACGVGTFVTCIIQSSSVTTVMVVGLVNAGLMSLSQAVGVILGANVGTTITGWILVLDIGKYGLPILGVAAFFYLFGRRERLRYTASVFVGLGMVFFGLELMKNGFAPLKSMPAFEEWFSKFTPDSYFGVLKCCLTGAFLTAVVQSSSATLGITMGLAYTGVIDFRAAAALVLGENIGTTITAILASLGASTNARRAAYAHTLFNVLGVAWITAIFGIYMQFIEWIVGTDPTTAVVAGGDVVYPHSMKAIAATHTGFNVANVILFMPFTGFMVRLLYRIAPEKEAEKPAHLAALDERLLETPVVAVEQSQKEVVRMGERVQKMLGTLRTILTGTAPQPDLEKQIFDDENLLDIIQKDVVEFLGKVLEERASHDVVESARRQLRIADELESISDYVMNILKLDLKIRDAAQTISPEGLEDLLQLHDRVADYIAHIVESVRREETDLLPVARSRGTAITHTMKQSRARHLARVGTGTTTPLKSLFYTDMLNSYRRIKDHALNIAEVLAGEK